MPTIAERPPANMTRADYRDHNDGNNNDDQLHAEHQSVIRHQHPSDTGAVLAEEIFVDNLLGKKGILYRLHVHGLSVHRRGVLSHRLSVHRRGVLSHGLSIHGGNEWLHRLSVCTHCRTDAVIVKRTRKGGNSISRGIIHIAVAV